MLQNYQTLFSIYNIKDETYEPLSNHHYPQNTHQLQREIKMNVSTHGLYIDLEIR